MATFTEIPHFASNFDTDSKITEVKFGDGYEQAIFNGINNEYRKYNLYFNNIEQSLADTIQAFFTDNETAITPFDWTPPTGAAGRFKCKKNKLTYSSGLHVNLSCVFEEVFF